MKNFLLVIFLISTFQMNAQYCIPTFNSDPSVLVHNFNLGDIVNRESYADSIGYRYYPQAEFTTLLEIGRTYPFTASNENAAGIKGDFAIWIDYNKDSIFSELERVHYVENVNHYTSGLLDVPNDPSILGVRRLRIAYIWTSSDLEPCGSYSNGEAEDYEVTFVSDNIDKDYYCMPFNALNTDNYFVNDFRFGEIINLSSETNDFNYSVFPESNFAGDFILGNTYDISVAVDSLNTNSDGGFTAWIDYNDNQIFETDEIVFQEGPEILGAQGTITIPADSSFLGKKRLRIRAERNADFPIDACGFDIGTETEDYTINIITEPTSINELEDEFIFSVFPNPANNLLYIKNKESVDYEYKIYNLLGQVEKYGSVDHQNIVPVDIHQLNTGMYILEIRKGQFEKQIKFFKSK